LLKPTTLAYSLGQPIEEKTMSLFKRAAVRGMAHELVRRNIVTFPSKQAMDEAADAVADASPMPEMAGEGGHEPEQVAEIAQKLIEIGHALMAQAGIEHHPGAPAGAPPLPMDGAGPEAAEAAKAASYLLKEASFTPLSDLASQAAISVMEKTAAETKTANPSGALMHGGDKQNTPADAAKSDSVAALDQKQRPQGEYHDGMGKTQLETAKGELGHQGKATVTPSNSPSGTNSVNADAHKSAAEKKLRDMLKAAASTLVGVASPAATKNKEHDAAKSDSVATLDLKNRPVDAYHVGQGKTNINEDEAARIGKEQKHPKAPSNSPSGTNSVVQASKLSEEDAFMVLFDKCAADEQKVAAVKAMIGLDHAGRQAYITDAYSKLAAAGNEETKTEDHNKYKRDPAHVDEIGAPQKKESALIERVRQIAAAPAT
jgi:hypothetical protein